MTPQETTSAAVVSFPLGRRTPEHINRDPRLSSHRFTGVDPGAPTRGARRTQSPFEYLEADWSPVRLQRSPNPDHNSMDEDQDGPASPKTPTDCIQHQGIQKWHYNSLTNTTYNFMSTGLTPRRRLFYTEEDSNKTATK